MSSHPPRLSEMVGIQPRKAEQQAVEPEWDEELADDSSAPMWAISGVMLLLGLAILFVAFKFLDPVEPELLRNPWTYALVTPVLLMLLSLVLNSFASRLIEKSMQLALLISVLVHLLLMVYAGSFVIMSRMWSSVMDSLAEQRQQLKRESLQAPQYVQLMSPRPPTERPDYLRFVPTEAEPTELEPTESPAMQLARAERSELVTPSPRRSEVVSPHLLEREQAVTSESAPSQSVRRLSRSELTRPAARSSSPAAKPLAEAVPEPALSAARLETSRRDARQRAAAQPTAPAELDRLPAQASRLSVANLARAAAPSAELSPTSDMAVASRGRVAAPRPVVESASPASLPETISPESSQSDLAASAPSLRRESGLAAPLMRRLPEPSAVEARRSPSPTLPLDMAFPTPAELAAIAPAPATSTGETYADIPRSMAGGRSGSAAPSSMPVRGVESLRSERQGDEMQLQASASASSRRSEASRSSISPSRDMGAASAPRWSGAPSISAGNAGISPSPLALSRQGQAAAADMADLAGMQGAIERASLGASAPSRPDANASSSVRALAQSEQGQQVEIADSPEQRGELESGATALGRRGSSNDGLEPAPSLPAVVDGRGNNANPSPSPITSDGFSPLRAELAGGEPIASANGDRGGLPRALAGQSRLPASASVEGLNEELSGLSEGDEGLAETPGLAMLGLRRSRGNDSSSLTNGSLAMDVEAEMGLGGVASLAELAGPVLPSRRERDLDQQLREQLESQRFERPEVGGPLAAGRALPAPAFQQRLDRLRDRGFRNERQVEPRTEQAIERGLAFLARYQRPDGSWRLQDFDTEVLMRSDTAATGLALLAFQGAGYTHKEDKYADQVGRALKFLAEHQRTDGDLYIPQDPASNQNAWLYSHAIASLAVCEAYGMTQDPELQPMAQKAIDFMVKSQDKSIGGWRYRPANGADTSVTGWFMMAFKSGQLAGLRVPQDTFDRIQRYLEASQVSSRQPHLYRYNPFAADTPQQRHGLQPTAVMTSVGLLMRLYFGWKRDRPEMMAGADYLLDNIPRNGTRSTSLRDTYYWYYATQVIFHMGGDHWQRWHDELYPLLIDSQVTTGENEGSWDPYRPTPDLWARYGGRLYVTTMNLLSLEVSYRHLPLYEATAK